MRFDARSAVLLAGIIFCVGFGALSIYFAATESLDLGTGVLLVCSLAINLMIGIGLLGAYRNPPDG